MTSLTPRRIQWRDPRPHETAMGTDAKVGTIGSKTGTRIVVAKIMPPHSANKSWALITWLPGYIEPRSVDSLDDAQALADQLLAAFIDAAGAEFTEDAR